MNKSGPPIFQYSITPVRFLFIPESRDGIEPGGRPGRSKARNQTGQDRNDHARDDETKRKMDGKRRRSEADQEAHQEGKGQPDHAAKKAERGGLD